MYDLTDICRTCMTYECDMTSIFTLSIGPPIDMMLMAITSIKPLPEDGLPSQICKACLEMLEKCFEFRQRIINVGSELRHLQTLSQHDHKNCADTLLECQESDDVGHPDKPIHVSDCENETEEELDEICLIEDEDSSISGMSDNLSESLQGTAINVDTLQPQRPSSVCDGLEYLNLQLSPGCSPMEDYLSEYEKSDSLLSMDDNIDCDDYLSTKNIQIEEESNIKKQVSDISDGSLEVISVDVTTTMPYNKKVKRRLDDKIFYSDVFENKNNQFHTSKKSLKQVSVKRSKKEEIISTIDGTIGENSHISVENNDEEGNLQIVNSNISNSAENVLKDSEKHSEISMGKPTDYLDYKRYYEDCVKIVHNTKKEDFVDNIRNTFVKIIVKGNGEKGKKEKGVAKNLQQDFQQIEDSHLTKYIQSANIVSNSQDKNNINTLQVDQETHSGSNGDSSDDVIFVNSSKIQPLGELNSQGTNDQRDLHQNEEVTKQITVEPHLKQILNGHTSVASLEVKSRVGTKPVKERQNNVPGYIHIMKEHAYAMNCNPLNVYCTICSKTLETFDSFQQHLNKFHKNVAKPRISQHSNKNEKVLLYICGNCLWHHKTIQAYNRHVCGKLYNFTECPICDEQLPSQAAQTFINHFWNCQSHRTKFICKWCKEEFDTRLKFCIHSLKHCHKRN